MYSDVYGYYNICSENYIQKIEYEKIIEIILEQNCFVQIDNQTFRNDNDFPWINIVIAYTEDGCYSIKDEKLDEVNLIAIVTSKRNDQTIYRDKLLRISRKLHWALFLEEDEEGNENIEIK
jgi:hypothetical protein